MVALVVEVVAGNSQRSQPVANHAPPSGGINIEWGPRGPERGPQGPNHSPSNFGIRRHVPLPFECADPETVSARHPGVCQEVASLLLGLTGETLTRNRSHTPTQRSREYFTLRSISFISLYIVYQCTSGAQGSAPQVNIYINVATHLLRSAGRPAMHLLHSAGQPAALRVSPWLFNISFCFLLCGSARCASFSYSAGQPAAPRVSLRLFNISFCSAGQPAVHLFRTLRVGPLLIFYTLRVSPLKPFSFCGPARPTSFVFCGSARHCVVGDHVNCNFLSKL